MLLRPRAGAFDQSTPVPCQMGVCKAALAAGIHLMLHPATTDMFHAAGEVPWLLPHRLPASAARTPVSSPHCVSLQACATHLARLPLFPPS